MGTTNRPYGLVSSAPYAVPAHRAVFNCCHPPQAVSLLPIDARYHTHALYLPNPTSFSNTLFPHSPMLPLVLVLWVSTRGNAVRLPLFTGVASGTKLRLPYSECTTHHHIVKVNSTFVKFNTAVVTGRHRRPRIKTRLAFPQSQPRAACSPPQRRVPRRRPPQCRRPSRPHPHPHPHPPPHTPQPLPRAGAAACSAA